MAPRTHSLSLWSGVALVGLGVIVNLISVLRHVQLMDQLNTGTWRPGRVSRDAVILSLVLAAIGVGMAIYLIFIRWRKWCRLTNLNLETPSRWELSDRLQEWSTTNSHGWKTLRKIDQGRVATEEDANS